MTTTSHRYSEKGGTTAETSFIEGDTDDRNIIRDPHIFLAIEILKKLYPNYGEKGLLTLETKMRKDGTTKVLVNGPYNGKNNPFTENGDINPKLPKTIFEKLGPTQEAVQQENEQSRRQVKDDIARNEEVANDPNEDERVRERARKKIDEGNRRLSELKNEREQLEEEMPLRERIKAIFRKYGFMVTAIALAVGATIGVIINALSKELRSVASGLGNGLKTLGKKKKEKYYPGCLA